MDCHPTQGTRNNSQQRTEDCTNVVPGHECCGGATAPALARTTISAPLLMDPRRVALSRPRKTSSPRRRPRATEMDDEERSTTRRPRYRFARRAASPRGSQTERGAHRDHRRAAGMDGVDDLGVVDALEVDPAPRGAMRKEMTDRNISSASAGMPAPG